MIDFDPLHARLDWALAHLEILKRAVSEFRDTEPYTVVAERNADTGACVWRVSVRSAPSRPLSFAVGDCVHAIRSTLDNLVWMLADGVSIEDRRRAAFPIAATQEEFGREPQQRKIRKLSTEAQRLIADVQPFAPNQLPAVLRVGLQTIGLPGGLSGGSFDLQDPYARTDERGRAERHPLWVLERLWNDDKHRAPPLVGMQSQASQLDYAGLTIPPGCSFELTFNIGVIHDGDMIARFTPVGFRSDAELKLRPAFEVAIDKEGEGFNKEPVVSLLRRLHDHVRENLLPQFAKL